MAQRQSSREVHAKPHRQPAEKVAPDPGSPGHPVASADGHRERISVTSTAGDVTLVRTSEIPRLHARVETFVPRLGRPPWIRPNVWVFADELPLYLRVAKGSRPLAREELFELARTAGQLSTKRPTIVALDRPEACDAQELDALKAIVDAGIPVVSLAEAAQRLWRMHPLNGGDVILPETSFVERLLIRALDIIVGIIGCFLLLLLLPFVSLAIWLEDRGPIFYSQQRVGLNGRIFKLHKFRSMRCDAESAGPVWARAGDDRVTRVGAPLRRSKLDELPQFLNILMGEMSLVGPRPERPFFVNALREQIPHYDLRHTVRPGLTGWATVKVGYGNSVEAKHLAHEFDVYYLRNRSLQFDCEILLRSILAIFITPEAADRFML